MCILLFSKISMKIILLFFTLLLTLAWAYTSWYWYTCNIKGFCDGETFSLNTDQRVEEAKAKLLPDRVVTSETVSENTLWQSSDELPRVIIDDTAQEEDSSDSSTDIIPLAICKTPLVWPIEFGKNNNIRQVKILEEFLLSRGEDITADGKYDQKDFEAVKRFQLEYKEEILEPWGITEPTGFVFRTTVKQMNEIACR